MKIIHLSTVGLVALAVASFANTPKAIGVASWYGGKHQGRKTASGRRFDKNELTAASPDLPLGSQIRVMNLDNGRSVVVTVTDRGPALRLHRILDLSEFAAIQLDYKQKGIARVLITPAYFDAESSRMILQLEEDGTTESEGTPVNNII